MKTKKNDIGLTLLFAKKVNTLYEAQLKSYTVKAISWKQLNEAVDIIASKHSESLKFIGLYDVFYVSGGFKEGCMLGKSSIEILNTRKKARSLIKKTKNYSCSDLDSIENYNWLLFSMVYFYENPPKDKFTITCLTAVKSNNLDNAINKVNNIANKKTFKKKMIRPIDKLNSENLLFIGVEDVYVIRENPMIGEAFQILYKDYRSINSLKKILPSMLELKKYDW